VLIRKGNLLFAYNLKLKHKQSLTILNTMETIAFTFNGNLVIMSIISDPTFSSELVPQQNIELTNEDFVQELFENSCPI
jgi:hypothetical protein